MGSSGGAGLEQAVSTSAETINKTPVEIDLIGMV
jgi:hypothetical protein